MTVSESIIEYLRECEEKIKSVDTDSLKGTSISYGLKKEPSQNIKHYLSGRKIYTEYYEFTARMDNKTNPERISNNAFFEQLADKLDENNVNGILPELAAGRCKSIDISVPFHVVVSAVDSAVYAFTLKIVYEKEK